MTSLEWRVVLMAALTGIGLLLPAVIIARLTTDAAASSGWALAYIGIGVASFVVAGFVAGWQRPPTPVLHGGAAAMLTAVSAWAFRLIASFESDAINPPAMLIVALLALSSGVGGALLADWATRRRSARTAPPIPLAKR